MYALATSAGPRLAGAFIRNVQTRLTEPAAGATNTATTATLKAVALDPFRRSLGIRFQLDVAGVFATPLLQTSAVVAGYGWADTSISWTSSAISNRPWYYRAQTVVSALGAGPTFTSRYARGVTFDQSGGAGVPRALYLYLNKSMWSRSVAARSLSLVVNKTIWSRPVVARSLYVYAHRTMYPGVLHVAARSLYLYVATRDGEVFPYLERLSPGEQYVGGQVDLFGDGFGQYLELAAGSTITVSSVNGSNAAAYAVNRLSTEWQSTSGAAAWIRFAFGSSKRVAAIVLEGARNSTLWGIPRFRFSDASSQDGSVALAEPSMAAVTEYPVGAWRQAYWLAAPKATDYVEVAVASGGSGTNRGLSEVWVLEDVDPAQNAEAARAILNLGLPAQQHMGIASWQNRSPNLHPANSGIAIGKAATVTIPAGAVSGLVYVEEAS